MTIHHYTTTLEWQGNLGKGTQHYRAYSRNFALHADNKPSLPGSSDTAFLGDNTRWNPEEMLLGALSSCHQLWYLHLCADNGIIVIDYRDNATAEMRDDAPAGRFLSATLKPTVRISGKSDASLAEQLHEQAHQQCFIANSVNFPVHCTPTILIEE